MVVGRIAHDHHIWIVGKVDLTGSVAQLHVALVGTTSLAAKVRDEQGGKIQSDQLMRIAGARHRQDPAIDKFVTFFLILFPDKIVLEGEGFGTKRRF